MFVSVPWFPRPLLSRNVEPLGPSKGAHAPTQPRQSPGYFLKLFPQVKSKEVNNNYDFIKQLVFADTNRVKNITDAFFVILKSIFTPDIGDQNKIVMASFSIPGKRGFISYNLFDKEYYFDCNIISDRGDYFKVYIKDISARLEIKEALAIISTLKSRDWISLTF